MMSGTGLLRPLSLKARLLLFGAALPTLTLGLAFVIGAAVFEAWLLAHVDETLYGQAAVESVSLFDRDEPHLHADLSPLDEARSFAAPSALYDGAGRMVASTNLELYPKSAGFPQRLSPEQFPQSGAPQLVSLDHWRQLAAMVPDPQGRPHYLVLRAPLKDHERAVHAFYAVMGSGILIVGLWLVLVQTRHATRIEARVRRLAEHMRRVRDGHLETDFEPEAGKDVIAQLSRDIGDATQQLAAGRAMRARFLAEAAHELRTPLAAMRTTLDVALRRERSAQALKETLQETRAEVDRLGGLAHRLLDLLRVDRHPLASQVEGRAAGDLREVAEAAIDAVRASAEEAAQHLVLRAPAVASAHFDAQRVRQALDNLLANALTHGPAESRVELRVSESPGGGWVICVHDEGRGIPEDQREAVFTPFVRLDRRRKGAGLGLSIVAEVARQHGGRAWVEPGEGSRVCMSIGPHTQGG